MTDRVRPGKLILGRLGDIEAGVRQLIRVRPLEAVDVALPSGRTVRAPTAAETLRVKAFSSSGATRSATTSTSPR